MRELTGHKVNPANDRLRIAVIDAPGAGGANHVYWVSGFDTVQGIVAPPGTMEIIFQKGPIAEAGVNGLTHEVLLEIIIDRLRSFQAGQYACQENQLALNALEVAQKWLLERTRARTARGVEGTHQP